MSGISGILLAAGSGRRFGAHKLLQPLPDGTPVGMASAMHLHKALPQSIAVVRKGDTRLIGLLEQTGLTIIEHPDSDKGMGSSLALGVQATTPAEGWVVALADMPWVCPETIEAVAEHLRSGVSLVAPQYGRRRGHPVGFSASWGDQLAALDGDVGARDLLAANAGSMTLHVTSDAGVLRDIDHPEDLHSSCWTV